MNHDRRNASLHGARLVQVMSNVDGTTSSFVVHDTQYHIAASFTDRAIGRYIKSGRDLGSLSNGRSVISLDEWHVLRMNDKQVILVVDRFRHVMEGYSSAGTEYLMQNAKIKRALEGRERQSPKRGVVEEDEEGYGETLEPGEWNYLESFYATQTQASPTKTQASPTKTQTSPTKTQASPTKKQRRNSESMESDDYEVPSGQWDLIVQQMVGAGLCSSPNRKTPKKVSTPSKDSPRKHPNLPLRISVGSPGSSKKVGSSPPGKAYSSPVSLKPEYSSSLPKARPESIFPGLSQSPHRASSSPKSPYTASSSPARSAVLSSPVRSTVLTSPLRSTVSPTRSVSPTKSIKSALKGSPQTATNRQSLPRYQVNMTPRRVLFEGEEEDRATPSLSSSKKVTPKRLRLYTDW